MGGGGLVCSFWYYIYHNYRIIQYYPAHVRAKSNHGHPLYFWPLVHFPVVLNPLPSDCIKVEQQVEGHTHHVTYKSAPRFQTLPFRDHYLYNEILCFSSSPFLSLSGMICRMLNRPVVVFPFRFCFYLSMYVFHTLRIVRCRHRSPADLP